LPRRERIPQEVEDAVLTALEKLPADRFASATQFAEALTRPATLRIVSRGALARPWLKDRRSWIALGVAAAALLVAAFLLSQGKGGNGLDKVVFLQKSFAHQAIFKARFAPDAQTIVYSAALEGNTPRLYVIRPDFPQPSPIGPDSTHLLAVSSKGALAVLVRARWLAHQLFSGTLAEMPIGGGAPRELLAEVREADWSPDGSALAIIHVVGGKDRLEYPIGKVLYEASGYLSDLRVSPSGAAIALFEHPNRWDDRGEVILVDNAGTRTLLSDGYDALEGLAWSADGRGVLFSGSLGGEYRQVRSVERRRRARLLLPSPGNLTIHDVAAGGRWLATSDVEQDRLFARTPGGREDRDLSWLDRSQNPAISADGRLLLFTNAALDAGNNYATMLRSTDGSPPVRLGEGTAFDLSADGRWALSVIQTPQQVMLYPTGPGQARRLDHGELQAFSSVRFFADGKQVVVCGNAKGRAPRCYARALDDGELRPVTPEGTDAALPSPSGREVLAHHIDGKFQVYPVDGGEPRAIASLSAEDQVIGWSLDGRSLQVKQRGAIPLRVEQLDVATGRRTLFFESAPAGRAGLLSIGRASLSLGSKAYAYSTRVYVSQLFTIEGMR
jgi:Tol biopolymer transport system component